VRRRILQSTLLVVALTAFVLGGPLALTTWQLVDDFDRARLTASLEQVAARLDGPGTEVDRAGLELAVPAGGRLILERAGEPTLIIGADVGEDPVSEALPFGPGGMITMEEPRAVLLGQQVQVTFAVLLLVVLSVATGTVVATLTARRLALPLRDVADRAARLGAGDFRAAPARHGIPELDRVSDVLDTSATALAELVQRERALVGDVSHQLRSRLTALQLRLDELSTHPDESARTEALAALEQAEKLSAVLDELRDGLAAVVEEWRPVFRTAGRAFKVRLPEGMLARVTPARIREAVGVLLDNALRHGGGTVVLAARAGEKSLVVDVTDAGEGIPGELVPHVFERGVSVGSSTGIGLALARALVEADGGRLELSRARPPTFSIFLPAARADDVVVPARRGGTPR
jgi:signal transduction histidine kinase